jgi:hypothetical protein
MGRTEPRKPKSPITSGLDKRVGSQPTSENPQLPNGLVFGFWVTTPYMAATWPWKWLHHINKNLIQKIGQASSIAPPPFVYHKA